MTAHFLSGMLQALGVGVSPVTLRWLRGTALRGRTRNTDLTVLIGGLAMKTIVASDNIEYTMSLGTLPDGNFFLCQERPEVERILTSSD